MEGDTEATETKLGTCQRGLGAYNAIKATLKPLNAQMLIMVIWLLLKSL